VTIEKLLKNAKAEVTAYERYEVGAGIEKKQDDFVAEVMAQVKGRHPLKGVYSHEKTPPRAGFFSNTEERGWKPMNEPSKPRFSRILVKTVRGSSARFGRVRASTRRYSNAIAGELQDIIQMGVQTAVVIGGGNIFRGAGLRPSRHGSCCCRSHGHASRPS